jgi:hypothetical protein
LAAVLCGSAFADEAPVVAEQAGADPCLKPLEYLKECGTANLCGYDWFWSQVHIDGYLANSVTYNFNKPASRQNTYRVFDKKTRAYTFNMMQIHIRKESTEESPWGFATKLDLGLDADAVAGYRSNNTDHFDVQEAYVSYLFRTCIGKGLLVKAGRFATLAGAEVIEEKDDFNISRSFLFGYAEPFTHTGVRGSWTLSDIWTLHFGVNRGWDTAATDNNHALTGEVGVTANLSEKLTLSAAGYYGAEQVDDSGNNRRLLDLVATYKFTEKLTGVLTADFGAEDGAGVNGGNAKWRGVAGYLKYDFTDRFSLAGRAEVFGDPDGARTGTEQSLSEATVTAQYKFRENLWGRLEYRFDRSNKDTFERRDYFAGNQGTVAASVLMTF